MRPRHTVAWQYELGMLSSALLSLLLNPYLNLPGIVLRLLWPVPISGAAVKGPVQVPLPHMALQRS